MGQFAFPRCIHTPNLGFPPQMIKAICSGHEYSTDKVRGQGQSDPKMVCETLQSKVTFTLKIWDSYLQYI